MKKLLLSLFVFLITASLNYSQTPLTEAVDFTATDVEGHEWNLFELLDSGQWVCIDFFFTTCGPCQETAPKVNEAYIYFGCNTSNVTFLAIDNGDTDAECIEFDETFGVEYPTISGVEGGGTEICNDYQIPAYPTVILIEPDHEIVEQDIWPIPSAQTIIDALESHGLEESECQWVGVEEHIATEGINSLSAYPNPFNESFILDLDLNEKSNLCIEVYNMQGSLIESIPHTNYTSGQNSIDISLSGQEAGLYYIRIIDAEREVANAKVQKL